MKPMPRAGCMTNQGLSAARLRIAARSRESDLNRGPASYCKIESCISDSYGVAESPTDRDLATDFGSRSDRPMNKDPASGPGHPTSNQAPVCGGSIPHHPIERLRAPPIVRLG